MKNMKTMKVAMLGIVAMAAVAGWAEDVVVRDGKREWRFAEVNGTSRLPFEYMRIARRVSSASGSRLATCQRRFSVIRARWAKSM